VEGHHDISKGKSVSSMWIHAAAGYLN